MGKSGQACGEIVEQGNMPEKEREGGKRIRELKGKGESKQQRKRRGGYTNINLILSEGEVKKRKWQKKTPKTR